MRAVVDTSAWVSAVLSRGGRSAQLINAFEADRFTLVTSEPAFAEVEEVLERPELIRSGEARQRARSLLARIRRHAEFVPLQGNVTLCRDPNDDIVIETAIRGSVEALVAEDKDLTDDVNVRAALGVLGTRVFTLAQFLDELQRPSRDNGT